MRRTKIVVGLLVVVVAIVAVAVLVLRDRPPVEGDGVRTFASSDVGLPDDALSLRSPAAVRGLAVLMDVSDETSAVVDEDGKVVSRNVPLTPLLVRRDGSGVSTGKSYDPVRILGFDPKGRVTFDIDGERLRAIADADDAGATLPDGQLRAAVDNATADEIVVEACVTGAGGSASALLGLDSRTGKARWRRVEKREACGLRDELTRADKLVHSRVIGAEPLVVEAATGDVVWRTDDRESRVAVIDDVIYSQQRDGSLTRLDTVGRQMWSIDGCRDDVLAERPPGTIALRSSGPFMVLSCGSRLVAVDPSTGRSRDLPRDARAFDERYVEGSVNTDVAPPYLQEAPEEVLDRTVTPVIGTVLVRRSGRNVTATDALSGKRLWSHDAEADDRDRVTVQTVVPARGKGPGSVVVRSVSYDQSNDSDVWRGSVDVTVLDARTGREVAHTRDRGRWSVTGTPAGDVLLLRAGKDSVVALVNRS